VDLRIGTVLPDGATIASATFNGSPVKPKLVKTTRGLEATVSAKAGQRTAPRLSPPSSSSLAEKERLRVAVVV
jgi:hypothetical protein